MVENQETVRKILSWAAKSEFVFFFLSCRLSAVFCCRVVIFTPVEPFACGLYLYEAFLFCSVFLYVFYAL